MVIGSLPPTTTRTLPMRTAAEACAEVAAPPADLVNLGPARAASPCAARLGEEAQAFGTQAALTLAPGALGASWARAQGALVRQLERQVLFTPQAWEGLQKLEPEQRQTFFGLASTLSQGSWLGAARTDSNLLSLLAAGRLGERDSQGATLLDNLVTLRGQELDRGLGGAEARRELVEQTLAALANPDTICQGRHGTCPVASLEYATARSQPSEYVRLLVGLVGPAGGVKLANGDWMARDDGLEKRDQSGRPDISRFFQGSLMQYAVGPLVDYDNLADWNRPLQASAQQTSGINKGLFTPEIKSAVEGITGLRYDAPSYRDQPVERADFLRRTEAAAQAGAPVPVVLRWVRPQGLDQGFHVVLFEGFAGDRVLLRNPQGAVDDGSPGAPELDFPTRESLGGGHLSMPAQVFYDRLQAWFAPSVHNAQDSEP